MAPSSLLDAGGYALIAIGTFFEGEMIMLAAGLAAAGGLLSLPLCIAAGLGGTLVSDLTCFALGRLAGPRLARWFPRLHQRASGIFHLIENHQERLLLFFQFFPGLCTVVPLAFGMSRISWWRFLALDALGAAFWTLALGFGGYFCGTALGPWLETAGTARTVAAYAVILGVFATLLWQARRMAGKAAAR